MEAGVLRYGLFLSLERNCSKNVSAVSAFVSGIEVAVKTQSEGAKAALELVWPCLSIIWTKFNKQRR